MENRNQNTDKDLHTVINEIKEDASGYISNRLNYYKLKAYEKGSKSGAFIFYGAIMGVLFFTIFLLVLLTLGFLIGELLNSLAAGFGILVLITIIITVICIANAKAVRRSFTNLIISIIKKVEEDED